MPARILFVEDNVSLGENLCEIVGISGYDAAAVTCAEAALAEIATKRVDLVVTDHRLPEMTGASLLTTLRSIGNRLPAVIVTEWVSDDAAETARRTGTEVLSKPIDIKRLLSVIEKQLAGKASSITRRTPRH